MRATLFGAVSALLLALPGGVFAQDTKPDEPKAAAPKSEEAKRDAPKAEEPKREAAAPAAELAFEEIQGGAEMDAILVQGGSFPPGTRFLVAKFDLNGDGVDELVVRIEHAELCTGKNCNMMVLAKRGPRWVAVYDDLTEKLELRDGQAGGWRNLAVAGRAFAFHRGAYKPEGRAAGTLKR